jgi:hypothetical protein
MKVKGLFLFIVLVASVAVAGVLARRRVELKPPSQAILKHWQMGCYSSKVFYAKDSR